MKTVSVAEAAKILGISKQRVLQLVREKRLRAWRVQSLRISVDDLERFRQARSQARRWNALVPVVRARLGVNDLREWYVSLPESEKEKIRRWATDWFGDQCQFVPDTELILAEYVMKVIRGEVR